MQVLQIIPRTHWYIFSWTWNRNFSSALGSLGSALTQTLLMVPQEDPLSRLNPWAPRPSCSRTESLTSSWGNSRTGTFEAIPTTDDGMRLVGMNGFRIMSNIRSWSNLFHHCFLRLYLSFILSSFNSNLFQFNRTTLDCDWSLKFPNAVKKTRWICGSCLGLLYPHTHAWHFTVSFCLRRLHRKFLEPQSFINKDNVFSKPMV